MKAHLLTIGDEILIGQIVDTNSAWMSQLLNLHGIEVVGKSSVGDDLPIILEGIRHAASTAEIVITTGGLGSTKDDKTKSAWLEMFGGGLVFRPDIQERIEAYFKKIEKTPAPIIFEQCWLPEVATILPNKVGSAAGMWFEKEGVIYISLPGVPFEMKYLMENEVVPRLKLRFQSRPIEHRTLLTAGEGESNIARRLESFENTLPSHLKLAYLPSLGEVRLRLTGIWEGEIVPDAMAKLSSILDEKAAELHNLLPDLVYGFGESNLQTEVGNILKQQNKSIGTAESCTGGFVAHLLTEVPGASSYFQGSVVTYSNDLKIKLLGVPTSILETTGAVSSECVVAMARGALDLLGTDVAIAISGIAGPTGGTPEKPVGTVWMAVADRHRVVAERHVFGRDRTKNIQTTAVFALNLLRKFLLGRC